MHDQCIQATFQPKISLYMMDLSFQSFDLQFNSLKAAQMRKLLTKPTSEKGRGNE
ncbi:hypothetical protein HYC85_018678 [Camellia sinensis]|uniref:Uncharacterized protein n=1 Tax=Camellia sinensis TaxID=4442 RepID=A0A7J7GXB2_CAMSI|nr:hypothetical protein HYC85_018678 [Camellia sinensis]